MLVAVVLRRLHHGDLRVGEVRHHVLEPVAVDAVVRVDHCDHFGILGGVRDQIIQRTALETGQGRNVEELEALAEHLAVSLDRLPDRRVLGVVVDDQDFVVRIIQRRQGVEGLFDHLRRLVVARHMHRDLGTVGRVGLHRQEFPAALVNPHRFGQFMGLGEQHDKHAEGAEGEQEAHGQAEPGAVLLAVVVADPHQYRTAKEGDKGQEGPAALAQGRAVDQQQGQREHRQYHRTDRQHAPLRNGYNRAFKVEFLLACGIEYAPVSAHRAFVAGLPGLVVGFDDKVVVALAVELVDQGAQVDGLVGLGRFGTATHAAVAWPADFRQQQRFAWELLLEVAGTVEDELAGILHRNEFPVWQDVRSHQVGMLGQLRMFFPDVPLLTGGHRYLYRRAHPVHVLDQRLRGDLLAEQRFVADHDPHDTARAVGQFDGFLDFPLVALKVRADPHPQGHAQAELFGQARNLRLCAFHRIDTDAVGQLAELFEVLAQFVLARVLALLRALALAERRIGETGNLLRPVGGGNRAVDQRPEPGE
ncbi:hypothetical protein D3C79_665930 [compost metagenome]